MSPHHDDFAAKVACRRYDLLGRLAGPDVELHRHPRVSQELGFTVEMGANAILVLLRKAPLDRHHRVRAYKRVRRVEQIGR